MTNRRVERERGGDLQRNHMLRSQPHATLPRHPDPRIHAKRNALGLQTTSETTDVTSVAYTEKPGFVGLGNGARRSIAYQPQ